MTKKQIFSWGINISLIGLAGIILVALVFNIQHGLHWTITNPVEQTWDNFAKILVKAGFGLITAAVVMHVSEQIEKESKPRKPRVSRKPVEKLD